MINLLSNLPPDAILSIRTSDDNPNHHIWNNNGIWFINMTVHYDQRKKTMRVRKSLETKDIIAARMIRDTVMREIKLNQYG